MSIKDRLAKKTGDLVNAQPATAKVEAISIAAENRLPRTGPGQMLAYRSHVQENNQRVEELYAEAISAMASYAGRDPEILEYDHED